MSESNNVPNSNNNENKAKKIIGIDSDSSQLSNFDEGMKNDDIISSSSDEENNNEKEDKEFKLKEKDKDFKSQDNIKLLGNKRAKSKEHKETNKQKNNYTKYKSYNNFDINKRFQPSLDVPLVSYDLFVELFNEKEKDKNPNKISNYTEEDYKKLYEEYKTNHEHKNSEEFFNYHKHDEWFLEKYNPYYFILFNYKERR